MVLEYVWAGSKFITSLADPICRGVEHGRSD